MALLILATVFLGFAHSYYLAGVFHAPLPSRIIHIHGTIFSCWILLLITQTSLVAAGRTDIHRRLGIAGFLLACLMVVVGVLAAANVRALICCLLVFAVNWLTAALVVFMGASSLSCCTGLCP